MSASHESLVTSYSTFPEKDEALSHCFGGNLYRPRVQRTTGYAVG